MVVPDDDLVVVPEERVVVPVLPLFTVADDDDVLRVPEVVAVPEPERVALPVPELLTVLRELTDLEEELVAERVMPVEASLEPTDLLETTLVPEDSATDLEEALFTAAETPSSLREPVVAREPEVRLAAPVPSTELPPLRP